MKDLFKCINSKIKEKKKKEEEMEKNVRQKRKQLEKKLSEFKHYFKKLDYGIYNFSNGEYRLSIINPFTVGYAKEVSIGRYVKDTSTFRYDLEEWLDEETIKYLCDNKENILKEIAKQYGCI